MLHHFVVITDAKHFATYANQVCKPDILYLDKSNILISDVKDAVYIPGTLQIHSVQREVPAKLNFYFNSPYKKGSDILQSIEYDLPASDLPHTSATDTDHGN